MKGGRVGEAGGGGHDGGPGRGRRHGGGRDNLHCMANGRGNTCDIMSKALGGRPLSRSRGIPLS